VGTICLYPNREEPELLRALEGQADKLLYLFRVGIWQGGKKFHREEPGLTIIPVKRSVWKKMSPLEGLRSGEG